MDHLDKLESVGEAVSKMTVEKNVAYGNAIKVVADLMHVLYPEGIHPDQYIDILIMTRTLDKLCRISHGQRDAFGESPWRDIAGYGLLGAAEDELRRDNDAGSNRQNAGDVADNSTKPRGTGAAACPGADTGMEVSVKGPWSGHHREDGEWMGDGHVSPGRTKKVITVHPKSGLTKNLYPSWEWRCPKCGSYNEKMKLRHRDEKWVEPNFEWDCHGCSVRHLVHTPKGGVYEYG